MPFVQKTYNNIANDLLSHITKGIVREHHEFETGRTEYRLLHSKVLDIVKVEGLESGVTLVFQKGKDYRLAGNMIVWLPEGKKPDESSSFFINYRLNAPVEITDTNPGSVVRTLVESIAVEMDFLYAQMNEVYKAGFIDTASGQSLDLVVSLLGIARKPAGYATGEITFGRKTDPDLIDITREAHVFEGIPAYKLHKSQVQGIQKVEGTVKGIPFSFRIERDFQFRDDTISFEGENSPDDGSVFYVDYSAFEEYIIHHDTRVSTFSKRPENVKIFRTITDTMLTRNKEGLWEVDIPVVAMTSGKEGNVYAGSVTVMPSPPIGIEYVINKQDILNGTDPEIDEELRERAKHALETAGKATLVSLKSAVEGVDGISGEVKVVDQPEGVPGIVQIIANGGNEEVIRRVIEDTRSAGIVVEFKRPKLVPLNVALTITPIQGLNPDEIRVQVEGMIRKYLSSLQIDEDVILSRIISTALSIAGVRDVFNVTINGQSENVEVNYDEKGELRSLDIFLGD